MEQPGLAGAIGAPFRGGIDRGVAGEVEDDGAAALPRRLNSRPSARPSPAVPPVITTRRGGARDGDSCPCMLYDLAIRSSHSNCCVQSKNWEVRRSLVSFMSNRLAESRDDRQASG